MIHYDFELDNLSFHDQEVGILDFDDCSNHWYAADIAFALRDVCDEDTDFRNSPSFQQFLKGYANATDLDEPILQDLPWLFRMHKLVLYTKLLRSVDIPQSEAYPEWMIRLRSKLTDHMNQYRSSLEVKHNTSK